MLTDPFDYANEDRLIDVLAGGPRRAVVVPDFDPRPGVGLAYSGPHGRPRMHKEFAQ